MHLLESALAWSALDDDPGWRRMADGLVTLCLEKMIEPASGALREFFAADWTPAPETAGRICEPGHHYEWAFLLDRWATLTDRKKPEAVGRLIAFADAHGIDPVRGVAINAVLVDGTVHDPSLHCAVPSRGNHILLHHRVEIIFYRRCLFTLFASAISIRRRIASGRPGVSGCFEAHSSIRRSKSG
jgi:hypothetical protein